MQAYESRDCQNLVGKLNQIVEQAQLTLQDPQRLTAERQRMIIALARFVCAEMLQGNARSGTAVAGLSCPAHARREA